MAGLLLSSAAWAQGMDAAPPARPGECYATVFVPAVFVTVTESLLQTPASAHNQTTPARYEWVDEKVLVPAGEVTIEVTPAQYEISEEQVLVAPAGDRSVTIPAVYKTVKDRVPVKTGPVLKAGQGGDAGNATLCLVEGTTEYQLVSRKVLVTPARSEKREVPARYKTVKHKKLVKPAETKKIMARERIRSRRVKKLMEPSRAVSVAVPAVYAEQTRQIMQTPGRMEWRAVLCETNATPALITALQTALRDASHYRGKLDGKYGAGTDAAVLAYQKAQGLPQHGVTLETLDRLGVARYE